MHLISRAAQKCVYWHGAQIRKYTGEPYWHHPVAVSEIVQTVDHTDEMVAAALLHDVIEDTDCNEGTMREEFGDAVTDLVMWLTDISRPIDGNREIRKKIDRQHIAVAPIAAKTIKLADLIDNSRSIIEHDLNFARIYLREKRLLLDEALKEGDANLWIQADAIVRAGSAK